MNVGEKLRHLRLMSKKTLKEQSELFGVSLNTVFRWEHNMNVPKKSLLQKISVYYDVPIDWLIQGNMIEDNSLNGALFHPEGNDEWQLLKMFRKLSKNDQYKVLGYIERIYVEGQS